MKANTMTFNDDSVEHTCDTCKKTKTIAMFYETGGWFYFEDAATDCECGGLYHCGEED